MKKNDFFHFLYSSPTAWNAVENTSKALLGAGFEELKENLPWKLKPCKKYFVIRNGSSLCAFVTPKEKPKQCILLGTHTDSPALKLKPNCEYQTNNYIQCGVEVYGGPLLSSWLNRDLGIAGRIVVEDKGIKEKVVNLTEAPCTIAQLAIHLDREVNEKGLILNQQEHLAAIMGLGNSENYLQKLLKEKTLLSHDLFLYPLEAPSYLGKNHELIAGYRLDNLSSAYAALQAISKASFAKDLFKVALFWDNEEIGSKSSQGADSSFLTDTLNRAYSLLGLSLEEHCMIRASSLAVSIDVSHALHPNYPNKSEPKHALLLGEGIAIKSNANMRYATDAHTSAIIQHLCKKNKIPLQMYVSRSDTRCGSTIGPVHASRSGMKTVDIGLPLLSMHSTRELISTKDQESLSLLLHSLLAENSCF